MKPVPPAVWRPLTEYDLPSLEAIEREVHAGLPERTDVILEKVRLFPDGCRKLMRGGEMLGYALAHPWRLYDVPALDAFLGALPPGADCLYMHDVAILSEARGAGSGRHFVEHLRTIAPAQGLRVLACVSVYDTAPLWSALGFVEARMPAASSALESYGTRAVYMTARVELTA